MTFKLVSLCCPVNRNVETLLNDRGIIEHLTQMTETIQKTEELKSELSMQEARKQMLQREQEEFQKAIVIQPLEPPQVIQHHHGGGGRGLMQVCAVNTIRSNFTVLSLIFCGAQRRLSFADSMFCVSTAPGSIQ